MLTALELSYSTSYPNSKDLGTAEWAGRQKNYACRLANEPLALGHHNPKVWSLQNIETILKIFIKKNVQIWMIFGKFGQFWATLGGF